MNDKLTEPNSHQVLTDVRELIAKRLDIDVAQVDAQTRMLDLPGIDSLKLLSGLVAVEDHFGVTLDEQQAMAVRTVGEIAGLVNTAIRSSGR
ncbi:acyl carrier protein [Antrihabitans cavernicola]|uniref:Acyl carrier protein n=1 Tax=Antrihabitans cavernicola TaxID=2495913 RepID=A0A5A7SI38_9NOCA|nr:acyl carrier protein [Spelaeibacter cavernicola]KAA0024155.1 acyl carrier protein [Spelaeibacter cavernicola]